MLHVVLSHINDGNARVILKAKGIIRNPHSVFNVGSKLIQDLSYILSQSITRFKANDITFAALARAILLW